MTDHIALRPNLIRIYAVLRQKAGEIVPYQQLETLLAGKNLRNMLAVRIHEMRKQGIPIETVSGIGYRLKLKKQKPMHICNVNGQAHDYANDIQSAILNVMASYRDEVGLESQIAIMGVAIGSFLNQLPKYDRDHFTKVLISNVKDAREFSALQTLQ